MRAVDGFREATLRFTTFLLISLCPIALLAQTFKNPGIR
jgi:hypothetical protein